MRGTWDKLVQVIQSWTIIVWVGYALNGSHSEGFWKLKYKNYILTRKKAFDLQYTMKLTVWYSPWSLLWVCLNPRHSVECGSSSLHYKNGDQWKSLMLKCISLISQVSAWLVFATVMGWKTKRIYTKIFVAIASSKTSATTLYWVLTNLRLRSDAPMRPCPHL